MKKAENAVDDAVDKIEDLVNPDASDSDDDVQKEGNYLFLTLFSSVKFNLG